jgi:nitric oxide reductase NorD protein
VEFDQLIFQKLIRFYQRKKKTDPAVAARTVTLEDIKPKLILLARALTGDTIDIAPAARDGGWQNNIFYLPASFSLLPTSEGNLSYYIYRTCYLYVQRQLGFNWLADNKEELKNARQKSADTANRVLEALFNEFSSLEPVYKEIKLALEENAARHKQTTPDYSWLYGHWMKNHPEKTPAELEHINEIKKKISEVAITTEIEAKPADDVKTIQVDKKAQEDFMLTHNFEKVDTAEEFSGVWRDFDGDDTLKEDEEALSELNLKHTVRVDDPTHSVYKADFAGNLTIAESREVESEKFFITYPEWNFAKSEYKLDFCKVFPETINERNSDYYQQTIKQNSRVLLNLRKRFAQMDNIFESVRRQPTGQDIDIDAVTDMYADIKARHTPDERIYLSKRKRRKELAILFLLDLSLSSDGYTAGNRVLDVEKQVVIMFGEVLNEHEVTFEIGGFSSKTRNFCAYTTIKSFADTWDKGKYHVGAVQPSGYTRIGPALRHAGARLKLQEARKKWLVLLSDGKPNDYDRYEGKYGINDVKQALRELNAENINTYAVAIEDRARYYLPQMFGQNHYNILTSPVEMLQSLTKLYERIEKH